MINIFVIDKHMAYIDAIKSVFTDEQSINIVDWATTINEELLGKIKESGAEIIIMDLSVDNYFAVDFCPNIKKEFPKKKIIATTKGYSSYTLYEAWLNGVDAIVMQYCGKGELMDVIDAVNRGMKIIGKDVPNFDKHLGQGRKKKLVLTTRERKVLHLLAKGKTREQTATILLSSKEAVNFHCKNMCKKTNKSKIQDVIKEAKRQKLFN